MGKIQGVDKAKRGACCKKCPCEQFVRWPTFDVRGVGGGGDVGMLENLACMRSKMLNGGPRPDAFLVVRWLVNRLEAGISGLSPMLAMAAEVHCGLLFGSNGSCSSPPLSPASPLLLLAASSSSFLALKLPSTVWAPSRCCWRSPAPPPPPSPACRGRRLFKVNSWGAADSLPCTRTPRSLATVPLACIIIDVKPSPDAGIGVAPGAR